MSDLDMDRRVDEFLAAAVLPHMSVAGIEYPLAMTFTLESGRVIDLQGRATVFLDHQRIFVEATADPIGLKRSSAADILRMGLLQGLVGNDVLKVAVERGFQVKGAA